MPDPSPSSPLSSLLAEHLDLVYAAALRQTRNPHLAEDITQSVFLLAARKHASIPPTHTAAWLIKVTRYITLTTLRANRRRRLHEQSAASEVSPMTTSFPTPDPTLDAHLDAALAALSHSDRELLLRRYFQNHPVSHIAASLCLTPNTTTKRLDRALQKLRRHLARHGLTDATLSALPITLLASALQKAPLALGPQILTASTTGAVVAVPLGVLLMTTTAKITLALAATVLLLTAGTAYMAVRFTRAVPVVLSVARSAPVATPEPANDTGYTSITGIVKDPAGNPLPDVLVTQGDPPQLVHGYFTTHTDADGRFTFARVQVGLNLTLAVHAPGFSPDLITGDVIANPTPFTFSLKPAHTLRVRLLDTRGNPIPHLALNPWRWRNTAVLMIYPYDVQRWGGPMSDADGIVTWTDAPADEVLYDPDPLTGKYLAMPFPLTASDQLQNVTIRDPIHVALRAVDSQTNVPLSHFGVTYGDGDTASNVRYWQDDQGIEPKAVTNGEYQTTIGSISPYVPFQFYRISAPGYAPVVHSFDAGQTSVSLTYQLSKRDGFLLLIHEPDGVSRAAHAAVYTIPSSQNFSLQSSDYFHNGRFAMGGGQALQHADGDGHVFIADPHDPAARIVILHDSGFAELLFTDAAKAPITLQPWASVDGIARIGPHPAAHKTVTVGYTADHPEPPSIFGTFTTTTDDAGHFSFSQIPPAHSFIGVYLEANAGTRFGFSTIANPLETTFSPGENHLTLGGEGRAITGRIVNPDHTPLHAGIITMGELTTLPSKRPSPPAELLAKFKAIRQLPPAQAKAALEALRNSPEARAYEQQQHDAPHIREITFPIAPDGTFRIDDVPPDAYALSTTIFNLKDHTPLGTVTQPLVVPPSDAPLTLGDLPLTPPKSNP